MIKKTRKKKSSRNVSHLTDAAGKLSVFLWDLRTKQDKRTCHSFSFFFQQSAPVLPSCNTVIHHAKVNNNKDHNQCRKSKIVFYNLSFVPRQKCFKLVVFSPIHWLWWHHLRQFISFFLLHRLLFRVQTKPESESGRQTSDPLFEWRY